MIFVLSVDSKNESDVLRGCQIGIALAIKFCGMEPTDETIAMVKEYCPTPTDFFDGAPTEDELRRFFLKTLKGVVRIVEERKPCRA